MTSAQLRQAVAQVLEIEPDELETETDLTTIETFDSVSVLTLIIELDEQFGIRMTPRDASQLHYYRDIETLAQKQGITLTG